MIKQKQLYRHRPHMGEIGDCHRTAIACLLDLKPEQVPHFGEMNWDHERHDFIEGSNFHVHVAAYLATRGLSTVDVVYACSLEDLLRVQGQLNPNAYYLLGGESGSGVNHTVIGKGNEIVWDPAINDSGITGPTQPDGLYWVTYIVPTWATASNDPDIGKEVDEVALLRARLAEVDAERDRLNAIVNSPQSGDFIRAVSTEAEHQRQRWDEGHDSRKTPADWFWLIGYLAGKALHAQMSGDAGKAEHHMITTAAACANWHRTTITGSQESVIKEAAWVTPRVSA